jgi:hypothetical protein
VAGVGIVVTSCVEVSDTLGISKPFEELLISSIAELSGKAPLMFIATPCCE